MSFTKAKAMVFPRQVVAGHDVLDQIPGMCKEFLFKGSGVLVSGAKTRVIAGNRVRDGLVQAGYDVHVFEAGAATMETVRACAGLVKETKAQFVIGVGGGSKIDVAKMAAKEASIPFVSVPTSGAHDGIASPVASIKDGGKPHSLDAVMPMAIVADTMIIAKSPYRLLASGCADVIANTTAIRDWELAVRLKSAEFSTTAYTLAKMSAQVIIENAKHIKPHHEDSAWIAIKPIISSGISMSVAGSSRPTSGSEHMFSHALTLLSADRSLHGEQCGVGAIMMMYLHAGPWQQVRDTLAEVGAPTTGRELNYSKEEVIQALVRAHTIRPERYTILGESGLSEEAADKLVTVTGVA